MSSRCSECGALKNSDVEADSDVPTISPPYGADLSILQAVEARTTARLLSLDDEICGLKQRIQHLEGRRAEVLGQQKRSSTILSPLRRMPPEVLVEIFSWTLPLLEEMDGDVSDLQDCPWVLTQVCSRWRAISVATPSFWSTVFVDFNGGPGVHLDMVQTQVDRSQLLRVHFIGSEAHDSAPQIEMFQLLSKHSHRWERLDIHLTAAVASQLGTLNLSSLSRLWLQWDTEESEEGLESIDSFESAPSLFDVGYMNESRPVPFLFPAHQITCYRVRAPWATHQSALRMAPDLIEARITVVFDEDDWSDLWPSDEPILTAHLRHLYVSDVKILDYIQAPVLAELAFGIKEEDTRIGEVLDSFFLRSSCTPQRLCVQGQVDANITTAILGKYSFISRIALSFFYGDLVDVTRLTDEIDAHLDMLTLGNSNGVSPHLQEICFGSMAPFPFPVDYSRFIKMLKSRRTPGAALVSAVFLTEYGSEPTELETLSLDELKRDGLSLEVSSGMIARKCLQCWTYGCPWN
ncbi:hypothetical protein FB45DRAFT_921949 [Roridomyces roridus]|uniref:F-box domain-containing protein n=1 Tax=Roridomyces roridus TaxID=1738132 RepID=A0AAD7BNA7_9AGAR|nr:hypothetical protein FB45DRAFT_921949 [Roridomyces roridus]